MRGVVACLILGLTGCPGAPDASTTKPASAHSPSPTTMPTATPTPAPFGALTTEVVGTLMPTPSVTVGSQGASPP